MWEVIKCKVTSAAHYMFVAYNEQKKSNSDKAKVNILTNQDLKKKYSQQLYETVITNSWQSFL